MKASEKATQDNERERAEASPLGELGEIREIPTAKKEARSLTRRNEVEVNGKADVAGIRQRRRDLTRRKETEIKRAW